MGAAAVVALREREKATGAAPEGDEDDPHMEERFDVEFALEEIAWVLAVPDVPDMREPSSAPPPPPPTLADLQDWLQGDDADLRTHAAVAAGMLGLEARALVPLIAATMAHEDVEDLEDVTAAMETLDAGHEALLILRGRMARESLSQHDDELEALAELGELARDDVAACAGEYIARGDQFDRSRIFRVMKATGVDARPHRDALVAALAGEEWEMRAAARLLESDPALARELLPELSAALVSGVARFPCDARHPILAAGGLPRGVAMQLLRSVEPRMRREVIAAIGPVSASPGDELALHLFAIALTVETPDESRAVLDALTRADAIDARDTDRLLDLLECRSVGHSIVADLCRTSTVARPRLLRMFEQGDVDVTWPLAVLGPRAADALPRLVIEARDQDGGATYAVGAIGAAGAESLRDVLEGQYDVLCRAVVSGALGGVRDTAENRAEAHVDAACRAFLALLVDVPTERLVSELAGLLRDEDPDVRWAAEQLRR